MGTPLQRHSTGYESQSLIQVCAIQWFKCLEMATKDLLGIEKDRVFGSAMKTLLGIPKPTLSGSGVMRVISSTFSRRNREAIGQDQCRERAEALALEALDLITPYLHLAEETLART